ncbi:hypothetical protein K523DRAFT_267392 [Schizophyllum commune Tattone D]|nr:hypothetical protein K523DRAFT_267392 [Schizophyllum commune Tattone D]
MHCEDGMAVLQRIDDAVVEANPRNQAKLLQPLSQPNTWRRAFPSLSATDIPQVSSEVGCPVNPRIRRVIAEMQVLATTLMPSSERTASSRVLYALLFGFRTLWDSVWAWMDFMNPLYGTLLSKGRDRLALSVTLPAVLAMALRLASKDPDPHFRDSDTVQAPLEMLIALWYHGYGLDDSDHALMQLERDSDETLFLRTQHSQETIRELIRKTDSPFYDRTIEAMYRISRGHPERLRRRMLANLDRGLYLRHDISDNTLRHVYIQPIHYLTRISSYNFPPSSSKTIRRQTRHLLELSRAPETMQRAACMCTIIFALHVTESSGRAISLALSAGLLTGLANITAHLSQTPSHRLSFLPGLVEVTLTVVCMTFRLRRVAERFVRTTDELQFLSELPSDLGMLPMRWKQLVDDKRILSATWTRSFQACELAFADRIFAEELTRGYVNAGHSVIRERAATPEFQEDLREGRHAVVHVRYHGKTSGIDFQVATRESEGGGARHPMLYITADFAYYHVQETLNLDPFPLQDFLDMVVVDQPMYYWQRS